MKKSEALHILGLSEGATDDDVKRAHRKLVIEHHPDKFPLDSKEHAEAEELTKQINEARDVLVNHSWTPEFDPRRDPRPYAGNPYAHPTAGSAGAGGQGVGGAGDWANPFAGWPFDVAPGSGTRTTYVWTSWDGVRTSSGQGAGQAGTGWPFDVTVGYDPFDPFAPFRAEAPREDPHEALEHARANLNRELLVVSAKAAVGIVLSLLGSIATGLFLYVMASIVLGLYKRLGSWLAFLFIPLAIIGIPFVLLIAPRAGAVSAGLAVAFFVAVFFDVRNVRDVWRVWRGMKAAAKERDEA